MNSEHIIEVCTILAKQEDLKATFIESGKGALIAGMGVFIGGLLGGPLGIAVGGTLTSIAVAANSRNKFKPVVQIINEMDTDQKTRLSNAVIEAIAAVKPENYAALITLVLSKQSVKEAILKEMGAFLMKELQYQIC